MVLGFKTEIKGVKTFFKERILCHFGGLILSDYLASYSGLEYERIAYRALIESLPPKKLTIRDDPHNRWKAGQKIHFATGVRTKLYDCFALGECKKVEGIVFVRTTDDKDVVVRIGRKATDEEINQLAIDDGFESVEEFLAFHLGEKRMVLKKVIYF